MLRRHLPLTVLLACQSTFCQAVADESRIWRDFLDWLRTQPPVAGSVLIPDYRSRLVSDGLSDSQAEARLSIIRRLAGERRLEIQAIDFDKMYVAGTNNYSKQPNGFLAGIISGLKPGMALDIAMGQGRNAVFLAGKAWDVTGFDISGEGLRLARERAAAGGLKINTVLSTHRAFDFGRDRWDLIVMTYSWAPFDDPDYMRRLFEGLRAGGLVLVEDNKGSLHAREPGRNPLLKWFEGFQVVRYEQATSGGEWGNPKNAVYRLLARKP